MTEEQIEIKMTHPDVADMLQSMVKVDQDMREKCETTPDFWDAEVDIKNTEQIRKIIAEFGFPTISMVGESGMNNAWLLVQHADHDVEFQKICLELMKAAPVGEIDKSCIAYLEDRIRVNQKLPQLYGTQFDQKDGKHVPRPIEDEEHVDERRAEMGMDTLEDQIKLMYEKYGKPSIN